MEQAEKNILKSLTQNYSFNHINFCIYFINNLMWFVLFYLLLCLPITLSHFIYFLF